MRMIVIQCESCANTCRGRTNEFQSLPDSWITVIQRDKDDLFYCSQTCFQASLQTQTIQPPECKMRRFLLIDGNADEHEGVLWGSGKVSIAYGAYELKSWKDLKHYYPGCGVTWIDQGGGE